MKRFTFSVPQNILFGEGVLKELPGAAGKLGGKHGFIISGPTLNRLGVVGQCEEILTQAGIAGKEISYSVPLIIGWGRLASLTYLVLVEKRIRIPAQILSLRWAVVLLWMWQKP